MCFGCRITRTIVRHPKNSVYLHALFFQEFISHFLHGRDVTDIFHNDCHQHYFYFVSPKFSGIFWVLQSLDKLWKIRFCNLTERCKILLIFFFCLLRSGPVIEHSFAKKFFLILPADASNISIYMLCAKKIHLSKLFCCVIDVLLKKHFIISFPLSSPPFAYHTIGYVYLPCTFPAL